MLAEVRRKYGGYILEWTRNDHEGTHIHIYDGDRPLGVWDIARQEGVLGLALNRKLKEAIKRFENEIPKG